MIVLTAVGRDRPGIAARLARVLFETGCNIEDASMSILCGEFAVILMLSAPPGLDLRELDSRFEPVRGDLHLQVALRELSEEPAGSASSAEEPAYLIHVTGTDHPGIVCRVTELLASREINVTDLQSKVVRVGGSPIYILVLEVVLPAKLDLDAFSVELQALAGEIGVEIRVNPVETAPL